MSVNEGDKPRHGDILLVRHGETDGNRSKILQVPTLPLNANGHVQARKAGERISKTFHVGKILCSDLQRTQDTAAPIAELTKAPLELTPLLQERSFGDLRGRPFAELQAEGISVFSEDYAPQNGESPAMFRERGHKAWAAVLEAVREVPAGQVLAVVTHGLVLNHFVKHYVEIGAEDASAAIIPFKNTSVSLLDANVPAGSRLRIMNIFNDDSHLSDEERDPTFGKVLRAAHI
ncbi:Fructose-2,6-bisphosphatase TIGAR [Hondaea fermentalgiana]|uniref:Fructose-2,6-bisphosphatase TIGAR n=1 Tax=Hondaea fermentalgiana TaxID=2315210 RepID=A0A2R5GVR9_9STRA|nr:Fructose-2,6-bisphosphatase TIGAR [Hondaea fermentalgiana]|eukprot:GBG32014.1 Fructose-2,6-bisphosphatase TIGAR [Hondaea fermentalgiana]